MTSVSQRRDLIIRGLSPADLARMTRSGELTRIRLGAYAEAGSVPMSAATAHRMLVHATLPHLSAEAVVSHMSAALLHRADLSRCDLRGTDLAGLDPLGTIITGAIVDIQQALVLAVALGLDVRTDEH